VPDKVLTNASVCQYKSPGQGLSKMFYESIPQKVVPVSHATEAAEKIKTGQVHSGQALFYENSHGKFYVVSDSHIDDSAFAEVAFIQEINGDLFQTESITAAWVETAEKLAEMFVSTETEPAIKTKTQLILGEPVNQIAHFTCGCCGQWFRGNVAHQLTFGQDQSYGICDSCEKYYT
jgi:hypothetical protein